jgi:hypothetical protein
LSTVGINRSLEKRIKHIYFQVERTLRTHGSVSEEIKLIHVVSGGQKLKAEPGGAWSRVMCSVDSLASAGIIAIQ